VDASASPSERDEADGKGVWSWSPDAGIKSRGWEFRRGDGG